MTAPTPSDLVERISGPPTEQPDARRRGPHWDRIVLGVLLTAAGVGLLLDGQFVSVPWHAAPAAGVILVGIAMLLSLVGGRGRGGLVTLGVALLLVATAVGVGADRFVGPAGDRTIVPGPADWPGTTTLAAGTVVVDLTRQPLPAAGRLEVHVGAGRIVVRAPADRPLGIEAEVVAGTITVDGTVARQGVDVDWTGPSPDAPVTVAVDIGAGDLEVTHVGP